MTETKTFNLTPLFLAWLGLFGAISVFTGNTGLLWVAAAPILIWLAFCLLVMTLGSIAMYMAYRNGQVITITNRKGVRRVQRGRPAVWVARR